jgi:hypothetical protein
LVRTEHPIRIAHDALTGLFSGPAQCAQLRLPGDVVRVRRSAFTVRVRRVKQIRKRDTVKDQMSLSVVLDFPSESL